MIEFVEYAHLSELQQRLVLELRNQPHVRAVSGTSQEISWEEHCVWLQQRQRSDFAVVRDRVWGAVHLTLEGRWGLFFDSAVHPFLPALASVALLDRAFTRFECVEALVLEGFERQLRFDQRLGMRRVGFEIVGGRRFHRLRLTSEEWDRGSPTQKAIRRLLQRTEVCWRDRSRSAKDLSLYPVDECL